MSTTPVSHQSTPKRPEVRPATPRGMPVWAGVLWILAIAGAWNILLVLFHNLMARLLS